MTFQFSNNAATTLASGISNSATSLTVASGKGALFPTPSGAQVFRATLVRLSDGAVEIVEVTAKSTDTFTVTRAQEGTTGLAFSAGDQFELRITAEYLNSTPTEVQAHAATSKATPVDADEIPLADSAASYGLKKLTWANLKSTLAAAFAGLAGNTFTGAQIYSDQVLSRGMTKDMGLVFVDKGNSGTSAQTLDYTAGSHQKLTVTGAFTLSTSNWPPTGNLGELMLELVNGASSVITWPTVNWVKSDGTFTTTFASNGITLQAAGTDFCLLWSRDAGTTVYGKWMR